MQAQTNVQFWILPSHLNHSMDICRRCRTNQDTLVKIKCKKNCQGCFNFRHGKIKQKSTEMLVEITSILTKTLPQSIPKNPPLHTRPCLQHSHEMLWPTPPWLGRCYPITKKTNAFQPKSKISLHKSKVAKVITGVENHWRMRFFKKHVNQSSKRKLQIGEFRPVPQSHGRIFPRLNDNGSRRAPWHSGVHRHPHQPKPTFWLMAVHVSERPNCCFWILVWYYSHPCEWTFLNIILNFWVCTYRYPPFSFCWFACRKSITCD